LEKKRKGGRLNVPLYEDQKRDQTVHSLVPGGEKKKKKQKTKRWCAGGADREEKKGTCGEIFLLNDGEEEKVGWGKKRGEKNAARVFARPGGGNWSYSTFHEGGGKGGGSLRKKKKKEGREPCSLPSSLVEKRKKRKKRADPLSVKRGGERRVTRKKGKKIACSLAEEEMADVWGEKGNV